MSADCDLEAVEGLLGGVLKKAAGEVSGLLAEPAPNVTFEPGFAENGIGLQVNYQVAKVANQFAVRNELRRRIFLVFKREGVVMIDPRGLCTCAAAGAAGQGAEELQPNGEQGSL